MKTLLQIVNAAIATLALTLALCLAVVCILYAFVLDLSPALVRQWPSLLWSTAIFALLGLLFLGSFTALLRKRSWGWPLQGLAILSLLPAGLMLKRLIS